MKSIIVSIILLLSVFNYNEPKEEIKFASYEYQNTMEINKLEIKPYSYEEMISIAIDKKMTEFSEKVNSINTSNTCEWFIKWKEIIDEYSAWNEPPLTVYEYYDSEDVYIIQRCIETETFEKDFESKCNVASVILNRCEARNQSPYEVVTASSQFAYGRKIISEDTKLALEYVFIFGDTTDGCMAFRSDIHPQTWHDWEIQFIDKAGHAFYK